MIMTAKVRLIVDQNFGWRFFGSLLGGTRTMARRMDILNAKKSQTRNNASENAVEENGRSDSLSLLSSSSVALESSVLFCKGKKVRFTGEKGAKNKQKASCVFFCSWLHRAGSQSPFGMNFLLRNGF